MTSVFGNHFARTPYSWCPVNMKLTAKHPWFYLHLGNGLYLQWNLLADWDEITVWQLGRWCITRPETLEEAEIRMESDLEALAEEHEANRYTEWYY